MFSEQELAYLQAQPLARIATVDNDGQPTVVVVGFQFDGARFYISGHQLGTMRKYKNIVAGHHKVSLIIDDLKSFLLTPQHAALRVIDYQPSQIAAVQSMDRTWC